jgi:gluconolactonase
MSFRTSDYRVIAEGLGYPEGPIAMPDGSVILTELEAQTLTRITADGTRGVLASMGGSPNAVAAGPGGRLFICNSGGFEFVHLDMQGAPVAPGTPDSICLTLDQPAAYVSGSIQWFDPATKQFGTLYDTFTNAAGASLPLKGPDDLVFDTSGGFWFTDFGKSRPRERDITGVYYAKADGSSIREVLFPLNAPNGIALSPGGGRLYVAETYTRRGLSWDLAGPGVLAHPALAGVPQLLTAAIPGQGILDSMKVDEQGNVYVATMLPQGNRPAQNGGLTVISPAGEILEFIELAVGGRFEPLPSNLCFGGPDRRTAFITLGGSCRLVACEMRVPGLPLEWSASG